MKEVEKKCGVILTRSQPLHQGHIDVIKKALQENDRVLVVLGSADKEGTERNPFSIEERRNMYYYMNDMLQDRRLTYMCLDDWSSDNEIPYESSVGSTNNNYKSVNKEWGNWFYYNIVRELGRKTFTLYYNDSKEIIENWFLPEIKDRITVQSMERSDYSSSNVRLKLLEGDSDYLQKALPYYSKYRISLLVDKYQSIMKEKEKKGC